jgi:hypothetical protein
MAPARPSCSAPARDLTLNESISLETSEKYFLRYIRVYVKMRSLKALSDPSQALYI